MQKRMETGIWVVGTWKSLQRVAMLFQFEFPYLYLQNSSVVDGKSIHLVFLISFVNGNPAINRHGTTDHGYTCLIKSTLVI